MKSFQDGADHGGGLIIVREIPVYSHCEHHLAPFFGFADVCYVLNGRIAGLSKIARVVDAFARRLQVQERLTGQVADAIDVALGAAGVGVMMQCRHLCMESRGIKIANTLTRTTAFRGCIERDASLRNDFLARNDLGRRVDRHLANGCD